MVVFSLFPGQVIRPLDSLNIGHWASESKKDLGTWSKFFVELELAAIILALGNLLT
jgi:hypothetical protein